MNNFINIFTVLMWFLGMITLYTYPRVAILFWSIPAGFAASTAITELYIKLKEK